MDVCFVPFAARSCQYTRSIGDVRAGDGSGVHDRPNKSRILLMSCILELFVGCWRGFEVGGERCLHRFTVSHVKSVKDGLNVMFLRDE